MPPWWATPWGGRKILRPTSGWNAIDAIALSVWGRLAVKEEGEEAGGGDVGEEDGGFVAEAHAAVEQA